MRDYELQVRNVGKTRQYPIQITIEVWDGKRTRRTFIDIPRDKAKEFLEAINEEDVVKINKEKK
jgi:hypothetical protein